MGLKTRMMARMIPSMMTRDQFTFPLINNEETRDIYGDSKHCPGEVSGNSTTTNISEMQ